MMTPVTSDVMTGTAVPLTAPGTTDTADATLMLDGPAPTGASTQTSPGARERVQRFTGMLHQAIDKVEQGLSSRRGAGASAQAAYAGEVRQYGQTVLDQVNTSPLRSAAIALGAGMILKKMLFSSAPQVKVQVVPVPVPTRSTSDSAVFRDQPATRWTNTASARLKEAGQGVMGTAGAAAEMGLAGTKAIGSALTRNASALPLQMRRATQGLLAKGQEYGGMARSGVQAYPLAGVGLITGAGALLTTLWMQRRPPVGDSAYRQVYGATPQRETGNAQTGASGMMASRPVASAMVMLGVGVMLGAMLKRQ